MAPSDDKTVWNWFLENLEDAGVDGSTPEEDVIVMASRLLELAMLADWIGKWEVSRSEVESGGFFVRWDRTGAGFSYHLAGFHPALIKAYLVHSS